MGRPCKPITWAALAINIYDDPKVAMAGAMPEGAIIQRIWIKCILEATKLADGGQLYISRSCPHTPETLADAFREDIKVVRLAIATFQKFGMIEINECGVIWLVNWSKWQHDRALRQRKLDWDRDYRQEKLSFHGQAALPPASELSSDYRTKTQEHVQATELSHDNRTMLSDTPYSNSNNNNNNTTPLPPAAGGDVLSKNGHEDPLAEFPEEWRAEALKMASARGAAQPISWAFTVCKSWAKNGRPSKPAEVGYYAGGYAKYTPLNKKQASDR